MHILRIFYQILHILREIQIFLKEKLVNIKNKSNRIQSCLLNKTIHHRIFSFTFFEKLLCLCWFYSRAPIISLSLKIFNNKYIMRILCNFIRNKSTYLTLGLYSLLYHFIFFIALFQIYSLFVFNFNFLVHKKIYFAIFYWIYLHISTYSAYYLHISALLTAYCMAYFGSFYCIKIRSLVISYKIWVGVMDNFY